MHRGTDQEVQFACWSDVDLNAKTYKVTEHLDLGFCPKDKEEGIIPIPDDLVELLQERKQRNPRTGLIFGREGDKRERNLLRIVKTLALRAGLNCGHCKTKSGQSCATHPVCRLIGLHKWRKTFASRIDQNRMPVRKIMRLLRHSNLATTMKYLADLDDDTTRGIVESAFAGVTGSAR